MEVVLKMMGKSTALVIPPSILKVLRIGAGQRFILETTSDNKIVLTLKRKFVLADMIAQCDLNALPPADLGFWDELPRGTRNSVKAGLGRSTSPMTAVHTHGRNEIPLDDGLGLVAYVVFAGGPNIERGSRWNGTALTKHTHSTRKRDALAASSAP